MTAVCGFLYGIPCGRPEEAHPRDVSHPFQPVAPAAKPEEPLPDYYRNREDMTGGMIAPPADAREETRKEECANCEGRGETYHEDAPYAGHYEACSLCRGTGIVPTPTAPRCICFKPSGEPDGPRYDCPIHGYEATVTPAPRKRQLWCRCPKCGIALKEEQVGFHGCDVARSKYLELVEHRDAPEPAQEVVLHRLDDSDAPMPWKQCYANGPNGYCEKWDHADAVATIRRKP